jgi:hypothetical protein
VVGREKRGKTKRGALSLLNEKREVVLRKDLSLLFRCKKSNDLINLSYRFLSSPPLLHSFGGKK